MIHREESPLMRAARTADLDWDITTSVLVLIGGIKSIGRFTAAFVPMMIILYIAAAIWVLVANVADIPAALALVFTGAFTGTSAVGGFAGAGIILAIQMGVARGLFSNESGLGSAPIVAAAAQTKTPVRQALVSATGTFWDTVVVCAMTGLVLVSSGHWQEGLGKAALTKAAFGDLHAVVPQWIAALKKGGKSWI